MAVDRNGRADYLERLIRITELAYGVVEQSECWVTNDNLRRCGQCMWCELADEIERHREEPSE